jgi:predicted nucleic acid-binding protein
VPADQIIGVDTSVAVPLLLADHTDHAAVQLWARGKTLALCGHALAETYSVLTRLPEGLRVTAEDAAEAIRRRFAPALCLAAGKTRQAPSALASAGVFGGATYDGLIALTALEHRVELVSRDARARAVYQRLGVRVISVG